MQRVQYGAGHYHAFIMQQFAWYVGHVNQFVLVAIALFPIVATSLNAAWQPLCFNPNDATCTQSTSRSAWRAMLQVG